MIILQVIIVEKRKLYTVFSSDSSEISRKSTGFGRETQEMFLYVCTFFFRSVLATLGWPGVRARSANRQGTLWAWYLCKFHVAVTRSTLFIFENEPREARSARGGKFGQGGRGIQV